MRAGDILQLVNGETVVVEQVQHELLENPQPLYNFAVEGNHNYYVAQSVEANVYDFVLTHNKNCGYENGRSKYIGEAGNYKGVRVDYQPKNDNPIHVQWKEPKMSQHSYPWNNELGLFEGLGSKHPINQSKAVDIAKKFYNMFIKK